MTEELSKWTDSLYELFTKEVSLYHELLEIENAKTEAINRVDGKKLEEFSRRSYELSVTASILEKSRMDAINDIYKKQKIDKPSNITLSDFLNNIDRKSNFRLKGITNSLKETVHNLKDRILLNEKLIKTRQELFQFTISSLQEAAEENELYSSDGTKNKSRPLMVNTQA